jgi:hypothetical protein
MDCKQTVNRKKCNCTYESCSRKGMCCDCVKYHAASRELPACFFPPVVEKTYDRSFERFAELVQSGQI